MKGGVIIVRSHIYKSAIYIRDMQQCLQFMVSLLWKVHGRADWALRMRA